MNSSGNHKAVFRAVALGLLIVVVVLPFADKTPHIDEESYLFIGREIQSSPLRPYDWWRAWQPLEKADNAFIYAHPPLFLWWMAGLEACLGEHHLPWMRVANLPFMFLLGFAFLQLSTRFTKSPGWSTVSFLVAPSVLLVLHQSLMIDLSYVALSTTAVMLLWEWRERGTRALAWASGIVFGVAALTKYPALALLVLTVVGSRRLLDFRAGLSRAWMILAVALGILAVWEVWTWDAYGAPHLLYVLVHAGDIERTPLLSRVAGNLAQLGWTVFAPPVVVLAALANGVRGWKVGVACLVAAGMAVVVLASPSILGVDLSGQVPRAWSLRFLLVLAFFLGTWSLTTLSLRSSQDRFLVVWAVVSLLVVVIGHNFASARYLVPAAVPMHLLLWRRLEESTRQVAHHPVVRYVAVGLGALISLSVGVADYKLATVYPGLGVDVDRQIAGIRGSDRVWFSGKWGFRYEMERLGFRYLQPGSHLTPGDLIIMPDTACPGDIAWIRGMAEVASFSYGDGGASLRTMDRMAGIGFYSEAFGLLPYGFATGPLETVRVFRIEE